MSIDEHKTRSLLLLGYDLSVVTVFFISIHINAQRALYPSIRRYFAVFLLLIIILQKIRTLFLVRSIHSKYKQSRLLLWKWFSYSIALSVDMLLLFFHSDRHLWTTCVHDSLAFAHIWILIPAGVQENCWMKQIQLADKRNDWCCWCRRTTGCCSD